MKIYVKPLFKIQELTDVIMSLYFKRDYTPQGKAHPTFLDEECTKEECHSAFRSFEDILSIARTYFPDTTAKSLMATLMKMQICVQYCSHIKKITFFSSSSDYVHNWAVGPATLEGKKGKYYVEGTYTPEDLIELCNLVTG